MNEHTQPILRGIIGTVTSFASIAVSLSDVEAWLRVLSLCIGCAVGIATFISIVRKWKQNKGGE